MMYVCRALIRSSFQIVCTCLKDDVMYMTLSLSEFPAPEFCGELLSEKTLHCWQQIVGLGVWCE